MNKKIPILTFTAALMLPIATASASGAGGNGHQPSERKLEHLSQELQLSADQKARLEAIFNEKHEKFRAIREETQSRVREVLSDEQMEKWETMKRQRFEKRHKIVEDAPNTNP